MRSKRTLLRRSRHLIESILRDVETGLSIQLKIDSSQIAALYSIRRYFSKEAASELTVDQLNSLCNINYSWITSYIDSHAIVIPGCCDLPISPDELGQLRRRKRERSFKELYTPAMLTHSKTNSYRRRLVPQGLNRFSGISPDVTLTVKQIGTDYICRLGIADYERGASYGEIWVKKKSHNSFVIDNKYSRVIIPLVRKIKDPTAFQKTADSTLLLRNSLRANLIQYLGVSLLHDLTVEKLYIKDVSQDVEQEETFIFTKSKQITYPTTLCKVFKGPGGPHKGMTFPLSADSLVKTTLNAYLQLVVEPQFSIKAKPLRWSLM